MQFCFQAFLNSGAMASVLDSFCIYHVTAPGQEPGAKDLPDGFVYPNMDELSEQVCFLCILYAIVGTSVLTDIDYGPEINFHGCFYSTIG